MHSKRGTYLIEASVILPMIILTLITVILIVMYYYDGSVSQSGMHRILRLETDAVTGKTRVMEERSSAEQGGAPMNGDISFEYSRKKITGHKEIHMIHEGLLRQEEGMILNSSVYITNGTRYVLRRQKIGEIIQD